MEKQLTEDTSVSLFNSTVNMTRRGEILIALGLLIDDN